MKKPSAWEAWKLLLLSLPKGIGAFLFAVIGLSVGIAASAVIIGLPLLAFVLIVCRRMMESEYGLTSAWMNGKQPADAPMADHGGPAREQRGLRSLLAVLADRRSYRGIVYCLLQLPAGVVCFTLAIVVPSVALAVTLSPAARMIVNGQFEYELFADGWLFEFIGRTFGLTPYEQSWIVGGFGLLLVLLVPAAVRMLGRFYAAWISGLAGPESEAATVHVPASLAAPGLSGMATSELPHDAEPASSSLPLEPDRLESRIAADTLRS
jgi:hypothetical protein